eukprot:3022527-Pleurochrysis_carterae.AAC.2
MNSFLASEALYSRLTESSQCAPDLAKAHSKGSGRVGKGSTVEGSQETGEKRGGEEGERVGGRDGERDPSGREIEKQIGSASPRAGAGARTRTRARTREREGCERRESKRERGGRESE